MRTSSLLHAALTLALAAALGACSGGGSGPSSPSGNGGDPSDSDDCGTVVEGSWFFDLHSVFGGPILDNATLTQNGCLVFAEQGTWRLSGPLDANDLWDVTITRDGETVGRFNGAFSAETGSPLFRFLSEFEGELDGVPLIEVVGRFNPGALSIASYDPPSASIAGGAEIEVTGNGFLDFGLQFVFDGRDAPVLEMIDNQTAVVQLPAGDDPVLVDVSVLSGDEEEGEATDSFTLSESFLYSPCLVITQGPWPLTLDGAAGSGSFVQADCVATLTVDGSEGDPVVSMTGAVDPLGIWDLSYLVDGAATGSGQASFTGEPATAFSGSVTLDAGGTLAISGELPPEEPTE